MKICRVANFVMWNSVMSFIFHVDQIVINYSYNDDLLSFWYQTRAQEHKNCCVANFRMGNTLWHSYFKLT